MRGLGSLGPKSQNPSQNSVPPHQLNKQTTDQTPERSVRSHECMRTCEEVAVVLREGSAGCRAWPQLKPHNAQQCPSPPLGRTLEVCSTSTNTSPRIPSLALLWPERDSRFGWCANGGPRSEWLAEHRLSVAEAWRWAVPMCPKQWEGLGRTVSSQRA